MSREEFAAAYRVEQELKLLRATLSSPLMHGGDRLDVVSVSLNKYQWAMLLALVERELQ
jgi:hypothetical protein